MGFSVMALLHRLHLGVGAHTVPLKQHSPKEKNGWEEAAAELSVACSRPSTSRSSLLILLMLTDDV
jgi:hypothetical protein